MAKKFKKSEVIAEADGFIVLLDGKALTTPAGKKMNLATEALARALADEWMEHGTPNKRVSEPLTRLVNTALDRVATTRAGVIDQLVKYAGTDLLCYRAERPADLVSRQQELWQPILDWAEAKFGAAFKVTSGIVHIEQPESSVAAIRRAIESRDDMSLTVLSGVVPQLGSVMLGIALIEGKLSAAEAFAASQVDETWQAELWGEDEEAAQRRAGVKADIVAAARLLELARG